MAGNRLRFEALEDRWNLAPLDLSAAVAPVPAGDHLPLEQVAMNYAKVEIDVRGADLGLVAPSADPIPAGFDAFLEIEGIRGETDDADATSTGTHAGGGGGGAGKVQMQDFHFFAKVNEESPELMLTSAIGRHAPDGSDDLSSASADTSTDPAGAGLQVPIKVKHGL